MFFQWKWKFIKMTGMCRCIPVIIYMTDMPGVLDIKWSPDLVGDSPVFGLVNSIGAAELYVIDQREGVGGGSTNIEVTKLTGVNLGENVLGLSLDWANRITKRYVESDQSIL
jgi:hypothetical protein